MATAPPPSNTLYVRNLTEKVPRDKLKRQLFTLFSNFGQPKDIVMRKGNKMRGQAWVVFNDSEAATKAKASMQDFLFFAKPLDIHFAKLTPEVLKLLEESFVYRPKTDVGGATTTTTSTSSSSNGGNKRAAGEGGEASSSENNKKVKLTSNEDDAHGTGADSNNPPHFILKCDSLPETCTQQMLQAVFARCVGFKEVRLIAVKGMAFIEFDTIPHAAVALASLRGYELIPNKDNVPAHRLRLNFSKQ